jgi:carbon monoxide dehydrogenase subunit G
MPLRIEERFQLRAPVDRVWSYLVDPQQVVHCLPGAELTEVVDERTFLGRVKVKVGPITAAYSGKVTITHRDNAEHVVSMMGEGRESGGAGSARLTMTSRLAMLPTGETEVRVTADVDIVGKAAQFGRGMIESVNKQLFKQFTTCVRGTLERPAEGAETGTAAATRAAVLPGEIATNVVGGQASPATQPVRALPLILRAMGEVVARMGRSIWHTLARVGRKRAL